MIYHIVMPSHWAMFEQEEMYFSETFEQETFIHCSTQEQLAGVLQRYYANAGTVLQLEIDEAKLGTPAIYEVATNGEKFPHIYGGINKAAIVHLSELREIAPGKYQVS